MEQMRKLKGGELFDLLRIVDKLDLDLSEIKELFFDNDDNVDVNDDKAVKERGVAIMDYFLKIILSKGEALRGPINELFAKLCNTTVEEIEALDYDVYLKLYSEFYQALDLKAFFALLKLPVFQAS
ncbi:hypothetical protein [Abiotrophia defectiva]|uniref:hypothetical protein n=1 Tax=Abiotrophia defectiva TaxID=46125 RepID=UPI0028E83996|nr:hypothetical protein [Abiotrophia defectiva]